MTLRLVLRAALWLLVGIGIGTALQLVLNMDVYNQTFGLYAAIVPHETWWAAGGLLIAAGAGWPYARGLASPGQAGPPVLLPIMAAVLADGYYLTEIGFTAARGLDTLWRVLSVLVPIYLLRRRLGLSQSAWIALPLAVSVAFVWMSARYTAVPLLPLPLEQGGQSPLHLLVFARDQLVALVSMAAAVALRRVAP